LTCDHDEAAQFALKMVDETEIGMKPKILITALAMGSMLLASGAAAAAEDYWFVSSSAFGSAWINRATVNPIGSLTRAWTLMVINPAISEDGGFYALSLVEFNCSKGEERQINSTMYRNDGSIITQEGEVSYFDPVASGSAGAQRLNVVCGIEPYSTSEGVSLDRAKQISAEAFSRKAR
jgi:hypothetical protein